MDTLDIIETFLNVKEQARILARQVWMDFKSHPHWIEGKEGTFEANPDKIIHALVHFSHDAHLTAKQTYTCLGAVGATDQTLSLIHALNTAKDAFKASVQDVQKQSEKGVLELLKEEGYADVKLIHVYRHVPSVPYHPCRITWSKGKNGKSIPITPEEAKALLLDYGESEAIKVQLSKLSVLDNSDKLVRFYPIKSHWLVNVSRLNEKGYTQYQRFTTSLPMFYLHNHKLPDPIISYADERPRKVERKDKQREAVPYLSAIGAYYAGRWE